MPRTSASALDMSRLRGAVARRAKVFASLAFVGLLIPGHTLFPALPWEAGRWALDLATHWQLLYAVVFVVCLCAWAWADKRPRVLPALLLASLPWAWTPGIWEPFKSSHASVPGNTESIQLRVATANVHLDTQSVQGLLAWLKTQNVDVVVLHEVSPVLAQRLSEQLDYPFISSLPKDDPFGTAVLSRFPLSAGGLQPHKASPRHLQQIGVELGARALNLFVIHPMPPIAPSLVTERDELIRAAMQSASREVQPALIVGDLNATVWSSALRLAAEQGWRSASPYLGSWPSSVPSWIGIGLDHVLMPAKAYAFDAVQGPAGQSDHRPVAVTVRLPLPAVSTQLH